MKRKAPVLKEIASSLGLSVSTVYAALQGRRDISEATRARVQEKAREVNYRPDLVARSLVTRETRAIGVVVPDLSGSFFVDVIKGIEAGCHSSNYHLLLCTTGEDADREDDEIDTLLNKRVDGLILASSHVRGSLNVLGRLAESETPFVLVDRRLPGGQFVGGDDVEVGYLATRHLIAEGYERIAHLRGPRVSTADDRYSGYLKALREARLKIRPEYVAAALYHQEASGAEAMTRMLQLSRPPDAVFAASDPIAIGAMEAARQLGVSVPDQLGIAGVGNHRYTPYLRVPLTTVEQNRVEIGRLAVECLLRKIKGEDNGAAVTLVEPQLLVRDSTRRRVATACAE